MKSNIEGKKITRTWWECGARRFYILTLILFIISISNFSEKVINWNEISHPDSIGNFSDFMGYLIYVYDWLNIVAPFIGFPILFLYKKNENTYILGYIVAITFIVLRVFSFIDGIFLIVLIFKDGLDTSLLIVPIFIMVISGLLLKAYIKAWPIFRYDSTTDPFDKTQRPN